MSYGRGGRGRVVPVEVAQQILEQRDQVVAELQKARRHSDELKARLASTSRARDELAARLEDVEEEARELREELARALVADPEDHDPEDQDTAKQGDSHRDETVALLSQRIDKLTSDLQRVQRRTDETVEAARRDERTRLLAGLGDVLDSVERALTMGDPEGPWRQGLEGIRGQLLAYLRGEGARLIGEPGEIMDPHLHQAISAVDDPSFEKGQIVRVERPGIVLDDPEATVVRPAQVVVAR